MNRYIIVFNDHVMEVEADDISSIVYMIDDIDWRHVVAIFENN